MGATRLRDRLWLWGMKVNVLQLIDRVGIGGQYLSEDDTAARFRDFLELSPFFAVEAWGTGARDETRWEHMALQRVRDRLSESVEPALGDDQVRAVDEIAAAAEGELRRRGKL